MALKTIIRGITWNHPRGYGPLEGDAARYQSLRPDVEIQWSRRSLGEFGEARLEQYVEQYDLVVLDHPFVGEASARGMIEPLDRHLPPALMDRLAIDSAGPSYGSYVWNAQLWALPVDAAAQVACYRPDLIERAQLPKSLDDVFTLAATSARRGKAIAIPLCSIDVFCTFLTLLAACEAAPDDASERLCAEDDGERAVALLKRLASVAAAGCLALNPIQLYERMSGSDEIVYCPFAFGYVNYSHRTRPVPIAFTDIPSVNGNGPSGALLGGAGLALSSSSKAKREAAAYAAWLAEPGYQASRYFELGGQPGSRTAWLSTACNAASRNYFSDTFATVARAYVRPRRAGFIEFFDRGSKLLHRAIADNASERPVVDPLNALYRTTMSGAS